MCIVSATEPCVNPNLVRAALAALPSGFEYSGIVVHLIHILQYTHIGWNSSQFTTDMYFITGIRQKGNLIISLFPDISKVNFIV